MQISENMGAPWPLHAGESIHVHVWCLKTTRKRVGGNRWDRHLESYSLQDTLTYPCMLGPVDYSAAVTDHSLQQGGTCSEGANEMCVTPGEVAMCVCCDPMLGPVEFTTIKSDPVSSSNIA